MPQAIVPHVLEGQLENVAPADAAHVNLLHGPVRRSAQHQHLRRACSELLPSSSPSLSPPAPALTTSMARKAAAISALSTMMRLTLRGRLCSTVLLKPGNVPWLRVPASGVHAMVNPNWGAPGATLCPTCSLTAVLHCEERVVELVEVVVEEEDHGHLSADEAQLQDVEGCMLSAAGVAPCPPQPAHRGSHGSRSRRRSGRR